MWPLDSRGASGSERQQQQQQQQTAIHQPSAPAGTVDVCSRLAAWHAAVTAAAELQPPDQPAQP